MKRRDNWQLLWDLLKCRFCIQMSAQVCEPLYIGKLCSQALLWTVINAQLSTAQYLHPLYSSSNVIKCTYTSFLATSCSRLGRRLILWLIARLRMCLGRVWKTRELEDFCATAFSMALISAARAWAKVDTGMKRTPSEHGKQQRLKKKGTVYIN